MSNKLDTYSFLPWIREGITNKITVDPAIDKLRGTLDITFPLKGTGIGAEKSRTIQKTVRLYGPGDIIGIDSKNIIKTEPHNWITNFEPNYLPYIDFYDEDFPWRYSPSESDGKGRLLPWLALVVLEEDTFKEGKDLMDKPLPYIQLNEDVQPQEVFQPSGQLWAWAHVHVNRDLITHDTIDFEPPEGVEIDQVKSKTEEMDSILSEFESLRNENPDMAYSRIICPVKLKEKTAYHAFLIPAFESGRLAGLGLDIENIFLAEGSGLSPTTPAWAAQNETGLTRTEEKKFPVYHRWYFRTSKVGDFEYLVRLLEPKTVDSRVGTRDMDVTDPGSDIKGITDDETKTNGESYAPLEGVLRLEGALRIPKMAIDDPETYQKYENWDQPYPRRFQKQLAAFINLAEEYQKNTPRETHTNAELPEKIKNEAADPSQPDPDPLITPPLYGCWHALTHRLLDPNDGIPNTNWLHRLNLDPRHRATSGFGTKIVQNNQEKYMESAWHQVGDVLEANRRIRLAQLAMFAAKRWFVRYLEPIKSTDQGAFLGLTQPVNTRFVSTGMTPEGKEETLTIHHQIKTSKVPPVMFSHSMRKFMRPGSRLIQTLNFDPVENPVTRLAEKINKDKIKPAPPKQAPEGISTTDVVSEALKPKLLPKFLIRWTEKYKGFKYLILGIALVILALLAIFVAPDLSTITPGFGSLSGVAMLIALLLLYLFYAIRRWESRISLAGLFDIKNQTPEAVKASPKMPDFRLTIAGSGIEFSTGENDSAEASRFKTALSEANALLQVYHEAAQTAIEAEKNRPALNFDAMTSATLRTLNPDNSIPSYILQTQVRIPPRLTAERPTEVFKEAMAYPEFDVPMYKPLISISADLFLPNINYVSQNSISLLETNQPFIEAYMVGLNHEFARELLWREYPTDQRGSYFRQFWDVSDFVYEQSDLDQLKQTAQSKLPEAATEEEIEKQLQEEIRESLKDIPKLHRWSKYSELGEHDHRENYKKTKLEETSAGSGSGEDKSELVLVIRGELLKKYPNAVIYAQRAQWQTTDGEIDNSKERQLVELTEEEKEKEDLPRTKVKTPLYEAKVDPDIYFFGFDLDAHTARGGAGGEGDTEPGWFFVIKERPGEPRFGLDVGSGDAGNGDLKVWNDLSWDMVLPGNGEGSFIEITSDTPSFAISDEAPGAGEGEKELQHYEDKQLSWNTNMNSSDLAYIL